MLVGIDISEYQGAVDWKTLKNNVNFVIMQSSYGNGYIDKWFGNNRQQARNLGLLRGFYHYAYPQYNTPEAEAEWFCKVLNGDPLQEGEVLFLDMEESYTGNKVDWSKRFLDYVFATTGVKPLFYSYQDYMNNNNWQPLVDAGYGLWLASYTYDPTKNTGNTQQWPFMAFQQWTDVKQVPGISGNVDGDAFFGDATTFKKYGFQPVQPAPEPQVVSTPITIPVTVTTTENTTSSSNLSTQPPTTSANLESTTTNTTITIQSKPLPEPTKPPFSLSYLIVKALLKIKSVLAWFIK